MINLDCKYYSRDNRVCVKGGQSQNSLTLPYKSQRKVLQLRVDKLQCMVTRPQNSITKAK